MEPCDCSKTKSCCACCPSGNRLIGNNCCSRKPSIWVGILH
uniref:Metallothionein n=1 Tax=Oryzias melastigma TaxID=30732 RepID=A0A3B3CCH3_ORYME